MREAIAFVGPSGYGLDAALFVQARVQVRPPVRRGDVQRLAEESPPGDLVICDGVFQVAPAVSHAELCLALDRGWRVWGVSSIGAIRAYELRAEGMRGFGEVFAMFKRFEDFADDELCLLHFPEPPWFPVTEALVNLRHALAERGPMLGIDAQGAQRAIDCLRTLWFGDRSQARMREVLRQEAGCDERQLGLLFSWLSEHRVKTRDLEALLLRHPWLDGSGDERTP